MSDSARRWQQWLWPMLLLGGAALAWIALLLGVDYVLGDEMPWQEFWVRLTGYSHADAQQALGNLPEVVVAILGIAVTVVSIILQLSATRYTPRVTEMFFLDRTNLLVIGFFVVASIQCIWATVTVHDAFVPHFTVLATLVMMTAAILILIPYFAYVFAFLEPERIVARLELQSLAEARGRGVARRSEDRQALVLRSVEQLADVAVNAIAQKDRVLASRVVDALRDLLLSYATHKKALGEGWFAMGRKLRRNPDFVAMDPGSVDALDRSRCWLEWKVLRQYQAIASESLVRLRPINQLVAIDTRYIGEAAIKSGDRPLLALVLKFFNTYLRASINARDVRCAYNILHQYRLLGEALLRGGRHNTALELARHFKYYGLTANAAGLSFVNETAAYDLCTLCELAHDLRSPVEREMLELFLEVDKQPETEAQERSLRGVRKAQIKLATFYLQRGAVELARQIWQDMEHERPERLSSIRMEMEEVEDPDFWEVIDRGYNFDYLDPERRKQLARFYTWFPGLEKGGVAAEDRFRQTLYGHAGATIRIPTPTKKDLPEE